MCLNLQQIRKTSRKMYLRHMIPGPLPHDFTHNLEEDTYRRKSNAGHDGAYL